MVFVSGYSISLKLRAGTAGLFNPIVLKSTKFSLKELIFLIIFSFSLFICSLSLVLKFSKSCFLMFNNLSSLIGYPKRFKYFSKSVSISLRDASSMKSFLFLMTFRKFSSSSRRSFGL